MNEIRMIFVKPKEGVNILLQDFSGHISPTGQSVPYSPYYRRRIQDGDLIIVDEKPSEKNEIKPVSSSGKKEK